MQELHYSTGWVILISSSTFCSRMQASRICFLCWAHSALWDRKWAPSLEWQSYLHFLYANILVLFAAKFQYSRKRRRDEEGKQSDKGCHSRVGAPFLSYNSLLPTEKTETLAACMHRVNLLFCVIYLTITTLLASFFSSFLLEERCRFLSNFTTSTAEVELPGEFLMPKANTVSSPALCAANLSLETFLPDLKVSYERFEI